MEKIASLYQAAKQNRSEDQIKNYREEVVRLMSSDPAAYIDNIQSILPSSVGIKTLKEFVSTNGISICSYQPIVECIHTCIKKCEKNKKDASLYKEALEFMTSFKNKYRHNFYMFENFKNDLKPNYLEAYYKNFPVLRKGKEVNFSKILKRFGESVIPDMLVYADIFGDPMKAMQPFRERYDRLDTITKLWLEECEKDVYIEGVFDKIFSGRKPTNSSTSQAEPTHLRMTPKIFVLNDLKKEHGDFLRKLFKEFYLNIPLVINTDETFNQLRKHIDGISNNINEYLALDMISRFEFEFFGSMTDIGLIDYHMEVNIFDGLDVGTDVPTRFMNMISNKICNELSEKYKTQLKQYGLVIEKPFDDGDDKFALWLKTVDDTLYQGYKENLGMHTERTILSIIDRREKIYQESIVLGEEKEVSFTESELESIQDLISFKENLITLVESEEERMNLQNEVYGLYESIGDLLDEDVADSVIPMLPGANQNIEIHSINEDWLNNTHNKKTGSTPDYLKNAHDLSWGEEDDAPPKKRPSASNDDKPDNDLPDSSSDKKEKDPLDKIEPFDYDSNKSDSSEDKKDDSSQKSSSGHIQNYYYYTYNNSNNTHSTTNTNSYNHSQDDHSRNKRVKSHDYGGLKEEKQVWELDVPNLDSYQEGFMDTIKEEGKFTIESVIVEDVLDDMKPESDNPIQDTMLDLDRKLSGIQQSMKSKVQGVQRTASAITKPFKRTSQWITNMVTRWKDANENDIKAKMADPHERSTLLSAFKSAIKYGSLMKAGLLLNPIIMFLTISKKWSDRKNTFRIRNEMIGELKAELEIIEEKIKDADQAQDRAAKYKLMRFRNELKKKLIRVGGTPEMKNMI